jgi:hypothetical protein
MQLIQDSLSGIRNVHGPRSAVTRWGVHDTAFRLDGGTRRSKVLALLHIREHAVPIPEVPAGNHAGPCVNLQLGWANGIEAIHCGGPTKDFAARPGDLTVRRAGLVHGVELPVVT